MILGMFLPMLFLALGAQAQPSVYFFGPSGAELVQKCRSVKILENDDKNKWSMINLQACGSYIEGVVDTISAVKIKHPTDVFFCVPEKATEEQFARVIVKYGDDHPEKLHLSAVVFVVNALSSAFPCNGEK